MTSRLQTFILQVSVPFWVYIIIKTISLGFQQYSQKATLFHESVFKWLDFTSKNFSLPKADEGYEAKETTDNRNDDAHVGDVWQPLGMDLRHLK